ncbi:hypothetical protein MIB92_07610 [Aestuariirhabdus sp. Z084]|uniref:translation initiation factor eIF-2B n=1 Tax=Aestuariirhabdus haliotis TaxID=2918751 RepID=UPI00201B3A77|nr:hypothetical protein [Aestuariirhabdus haliotis]MCL6415511.1 hypothetical protein [Aestuariirhabdus haliotis]MCL6419284.1 hypothetical protein [Aestuariirhabdus haliotis]
MNTQQFNQALQDIQQDRTQGASALARQCLGVLAASARDAVACDTQALLGLLDNRRQQLSASRPSMTPVQNLLDHWWHGVRSLADMSLSQCRLEAATEAERWIERSKSALSQAAEQAAVFIGGHKTLITHSLSGTVVELFQRLKGSHVQALVSESRPLNEGYSLARQLSEWQIPTRLLTDAQMGLFAPQADIALVGADSLLPDGSLVNKAGTLLLALAAREAAIPFCVCCESFKQRTPAMGPPLLETMPVDELGAPSLPGVQVNNTYFDITPARLIDYWIDENGVYSEPAPSSAPVKPDH